MRYRMFTELILTGTMLLTGACQKEKGYTGFMKPSDGEETVISVRTDKAAYKPGETIRFTASATPGADVYVRYMHLGKVVSEQPLNSSEWSWTAPSGNYKGYMAEVYKTTSAGEKILGTVGIDVSSDWARFPRYGFLSSFDVMSETAVNNIIGNLNRYHINGVQFQDWHWKHHWPLGGTRDNPLETYKDIASRNTSLTTLKDYISAIHSHGMKAIFYNLCFGALDDAAQDGVKESWYIFNDNGRNNKDMHALSAPFKSSIFLVNPDNPQWQEYIGEKTDDVYSVLDFDGYQIDQLGYRGTRYDYDGNTVDLPAGYASFINAMKSRQPAKDLIMNAVSGYGAERILGTGKMAFAYDEMWGDEADFTDLKTHIEDNNRFSGNGISTVFAAYMNYGKAGSLGSFNAPGVILTDAVMFALGGSHLELGEHMLCNEYFPNSSLGMPTELQNAMVAYYDFMTAYENLLRDGGEFNDVEVTSADGKLGIKPWAPERGKAITLCRKVGDRQVVHILNFTQANSLSWRDMDGTMPEPAQISEASVDINVTGNISSVWMASPDIDGGACKKLDFKQNSGKVRITMPSLKYWNMIVLEYE